MVTDVNTQAGLETAWLQAYYYKQYWMAVENALDTNNSSSRAKNYLDYYNAVNTNTGTNLSWEYDGVVALDNANEDNLTAARNELAYK